jgi:hypothetical protein
MQEVELYVKTERKFSPETHEAAGVCEHTITGQVDMYRPHCMIGLKKTKALTGADISALQIVQDVADKKMWKVKVYDISSFSGKMKARMNEIRTTPTLLINNFRIEGVPERDRLLSL